MVKVERVSGLKKSRIVHNRKLFYTIIILLIILGVLIYFIVKINNSKKITENNTSEINKSNSECLSDSNCVPNSCCHPSKCVGINEKPKCDRIFCSEECSGPLDCGAGTCACVNHTCIIR
jgi:hypothetical protein